MDNVFHRYLNIPVKYTPVYPDIDKSKNHHLILKRSEVSEEIHSWLGSLNLEFVKGAIFYLPPYFVVDAHIDIPELNNTVVKINWVYSVDGNFMEWFRKHTDTVMILTGILGSVLWMNGKFNDLDRRLIKIETVLIMQKIMPSELCITDIK